MLLRHLDRHAVEQGPRPCLIHWRSESYNILTYAQFAELSNRLAAAIKSRATAGTAGVVFVILKHHLMQLPLFVGCMRAGFVPSFLPFPSAKQDPDLYWQSHAEVIERTRPAAIVTYDDLMDGVAAIADKFGVPVLDIDQLEGEPETLSLPAEDSIALLQHSSGTTGLKKGVALTYRQIDRQVESYAKAAGLDQSSIVVSWLPYYHDMGLFTAFVTPLSVGATIVSFDAFEWVAQPDLLLRLIERFRGAHCWLPDFAFNHLVNTAPTDRRFDLASVKSLVSCSEPVRSSTFDLFAARFEAEGVPRSKLRACYAMAETCFAVSETPIGEGYEAIWYDAEGIEGACRAVRRHPGARGARPYVSNGEAIEGIDVRILAEASAPLAAGVPVGEILVRGEFVFSGYFANEEVTRAAFHGEWYRTGDIGFIDNGQLFITGRKKDILIVHGRNYYAHDIEAVASSVPGIVPGRVVALGVMNELVGSEEAIILAETELAELEHPALQRKVKQRIYGALELTPRKVQLVPPGSLIKTTSGKISRSENFTRFLAATQSEAL